MVRGPASLRPYFSEVRKATKYTCGPGKYLKVHYRNGAVEHLRGPQMIWFEETSHDEIEVWKF